MICGILRHMSGWNHSWRLFCVPADLELLFEALSPNLKRFKGDPFCAKAIRGETNENPVNYAVGSPFQLKHFRPGMILKHEYKADWSPNSRITDKLYNIGTSFRDHKRLQNQFGRGDACSWQYFKFSLMQYFPSSFLSNYVTEETCYPHLLSWRLKKFDTRGTVLSKSLFYLIALSLLFGDGLIQWSERT